MNLARSRGLAGFLARLRVSQATWVSRSRLLPVLVLLGGFALRCYRLGADSLWYDETVSLLLARSDFAELIRHTAGDIHPPLYYVVLRIWGLGAGWSGLAMEFFSLWFGVLLIALVYRAAREWFPSRPRIALLAAFLVALSPYNVWYSQEVRMYTLGAALGLLSVLFLRRLVRNPKPVSLDFWGYVLVTVAGFYTLYYFVFLIVFEYLYVAYASLIPFFIRGASRKDPPGSIRSLLLTFGISQLALLILYLPWVPVAFRQATDPPVPPWREFIPLPRVLVESLTALAFGQSVDPLIVAPLTLLLLAFIAAVLVLQLRMADGGRHPSFVLYPLSASPFFLIAYTFVPLAAIYLLSLWKPLYHVRYVFTYAPGFYLLVAFAVVTGGEGLREWLRTRQGAAPLWAKGFALLASLAFLATTGYALDNFWHDPQYAEDDLRGAVTYIADHWRPGDVILADAGYTYPAFEYYFPQPITRARLANPPSDAVADQPLVLETGSIGGAPDLGWGDPRSDFYATTADETRTALERLLEMYPRVWLFRLYDTVTDPNGIIRQYLQDHATQFDDQPFAGESQLRVQGWLGTASPDLPPPAVQLDQPLGDRVSLAGYELSARTLQRSAWLDVVLYWKLRQAVNTNYQVSLQLLNADGQNVAQTDELPLSDLLPMTRWQVGTLYRQPLRLHIPAGLSPGQYQTIVKLYNPRTLEVLGDPVALGKITIP